MRLLLTCPQGQVSGEKGRRHLLTRPWGRISATPHKTWVFPLLAPPLFSGPGATFGWPSQSRLRRASVSAAASVGRWATSHRDVAAPKGEPSLASPFGGRWCPVGTVQRLVSAAASVGDGRSPLGCITRAGRREWPRVSEDGEGKLPASPAAPVAIALAGACAVNCNCSLPVAGFFLADTH